MLHFDNFLCCKQRKLPDFSKRVSPEESFLIPASLMYALVKSAQSLQTWAAVNIFS